MAQVWNSIDNNIKCSPGFIIFCKKLGRNYNCTYRMTHLIIANAEHDRICIEMQ